MSKVSGTGMSDSELVWIFWSLPKNLLVILWIIGAVAFVGKRQDPLVAYLGRFTTDSFDIDVTLTALFEHRTWISVREATTPYNFLKAKISICCKYHLLHGFFIIQNKSVC